jgi:NADPH:quinone reductase-like Zn-dependent oxidoreductase
VRVHAAGLNRADIIQRQGKYPAPPGFPKDIPGLEFAGEVEAIGEEVRSWKLGQRVFGITVREKTDTTRRFAAYVLPLVVRGLVRPVIDRTYSLNKVRAAHERMESNASFGNIVLTLS